MIDDIDQYTEILIEITRFAFSSSLLSCFFIYFIHSIYSEMYAMQQSMAQQQGSHQQIFMPPRAPHLMPKVKFA